ncbi:MAG: nucleotidyltransferase domain-containing protein [Candidatus Moranbacteria bacterium]|nr:nucleotidyltransferase domain-containing protein [Candidatus Moranbacteria bacterium]
MDKEEVKKIIRDAIEHDPHKSEIKKVSLFGSYLHENAKAGSDVDILIEFKPKTSVGFFKLAEIYRHFKDRLGKEVDLVTPPALSKYFREEVIQSAEKIYEG